MAGFKISDSVTNGVLLAVITGVVWGVITNQSRLSVVEDRSDRIDRILEHVSEISSELGAHSQALNSILIQVNHFNERVNTIEDVQSRNSQTAIEHHEMYATKGSQVDANRVAIRDLERRFNASLVERAGG